MNTFEDDAINDDFEVASSQSDFQLSDLDPEQNRPISSAIAILRSRISFKAREDDTEATSPNDDFELEITDLPATNDDADRRARFIAAIADLSALLSPRSEEPDDDVVNDDFELEITDLPTHDAVDSITSVGAGVVSGGVGQGGEGGVGELVSARLVPARAVERRKGNGDRLITNLGTLHSRLPRKVRMLRLVTIGIAILLMLGVVLESVPSARDAVLSLLPRPTPTPIPASVTRGFREFGGFSQRVIGGGEISISSIPISGTTVVPWNPNTPVSNVLDPAPQTCPSASVPQDPDTVDFPYGNRVGGPPLWVMGFHGDPAQLTDFTRANPPQYGWVRQVTLMLEGNADGPVMLQGAHMLDDTPLLFNTPESGQSPTTFLTLNLDTSSTSDPGTDVQWGVQSVSLYIPAAGCYYLKASWAGGSWEVLFAAGS